MSDLITEDGNIRRYMNSEIIDEFLPNQAGYVGYPNGDGHGKRTADYAFAVTVAGPLQIYKRDDLRIRRLTPKDYWLLMGFGEEDYDRAKQVTSKMQLYKQAGNSIVVNCLVAIFGQMFEGKEEVYKNG